MNIYNIKYPGSWMGGNAVVIADNKQQAWEMLKENNEFLDPFHKCSFEVRLFLPGVVYNWDGEY